MVTDRFEALAAELSAQFPSLPLRRREPMKNHTSFRIGGPAALLALPQTAADLAAVYAAALEHEVRVIVMGNGSNLLAPDAELPALVIKTHDGLSSIRQTGPHALTAGSGTLLSRLAVAAKDAGLSGLAFAHGIPGTVGGAVCMNAGAYGGEMRDVVAETVYLDEQGQERRLVGEAHELSYRHSFFSAHPGILLSTRFFLSPGNSEEIAAQMSELAARRRESQPLELPSAGSVFKRPAGYYAAALIDECGLRGAACGGACVSSKHAGFIVNTGGASCGDVLRLIDHIRETVLRETGVLLEPEIKIL